MKIREANLSDIPGIQAIRLSVRENKLTDPSLVTDADCADFISQRGKGWVSEIENEVVGFAIVDIQENNIWALFVHPKHEGQGIGKGLHDHMLDNYFKQSRDTLWLGTEPGTRAEAFYRQAGWQAAGKHGEGELKFEMTFWTWRRKDA